MKTLRLKTHHFHTELSYRKPMLRHIKWWVQNGHITKNGVLAELLHFLWKFCFSLRTSYYKELFWYSNDPNAHIRTFCKRWSFIWRCFFPMCILKNLCIICNVHWKTPVLESLFNNFASLNGLKLYWKETLTQQVFSCEYCEIFRKSFFIEHLRWLRLNNIQKITLIFKVDHISLLPPATCPVS